MPNASVELRVYCICGQKMKVTEDMFGLPAKCIACRRKIRIPARDDVAPDVHEIHLKDHPEFLRKPKKSKKSLALAKAHAAADAKLPDRDFVPVCAAEHAGKVPELMRPLPLDSLDPLKEIASLRNKVLRELRKSKHGHGDLEEIRAILKGHLHKLDEARSYLDNEIRQKRHEVAAELAAVREKIVQTGLLARLEEINFTTYQSMTDRLRRQRDSLERLHYNLGAWLDVRDPRAAGGYVSLPFEAIPEPGFDVHWPDPPSDDAPLLEQHTQALRDAFGARERAKEKLEETARLRTEGVVSSAGVANIRAEAKIEKRKAEAEITHRRKRLEEFGQDTASDAQTIHSCLDRARKRTEEGALEKPAFEAVEHELVRAQRDCAKAHDVVTRALIAAASKDVPDTRGSYLERLAGVPAPPKPAPRLSTLLAYGNKGLGLDSWVAWASVLMLALAVFLPVVGNLSPLQACRTLAFQGSSVYWVAAAPLLAAALIMAAGAVPRRRARGYLLLALWLALTLLAVVAIHESRYSAGAVAERFNKDANWLMRPGVVLMVLADLMLIAAACTALCAQRRWWIPLAACAGVVFAVSGLIGSNLMGSAIAMPTLSIDSTPAEDPAKPASEVRVIIGNAGKRSLFLLPGRSVALNAFVYQLQRQNPAGWSDVAIQQVQLSGTDMAAADARASSHFRTLAIKPGVTAEFKYSLPPGEYRVQLLDAKGLREPLVSMLSITAPEPPPEPAPVAPLLESTEQAPVVEAPLPPLPVEAELKGIIIGPNREPRFSVLLHAPGKAPESVDAMLGDKIYGDWTIAEYNPSRQTLTITKDATVLIMSRNRRLPLVTTGP